MKYEESMKVRKQGRVYHAGASTVNSLTRIYRVEKGWRVERQEAHILTLAKAEAEKCKRTMKLDSEQDKEARGEYKKRMEEGVSLSHADLMNL